MRIGYMSDLHLRFNQDHESFIALLDPSVDVQVIAGDVIDGAFDIDLLRSLFKRFTIPVVFVPGNHEFFMKAVHPFEMERQLKALENEFSDLHVLNGETWQMPGGPRFVGTTMWYRSTIDMSLRHSSWADYRFIQDHHAFANAKFSADEGLLCSIEHHDVVVTHMLPSWKCVDNRFAGATTNELFVRNTEPLILDKKPAAWIHGHTHSPIDIWVGETRVLCNPRGCYRDSKPENPSFDPNMSFEWALDEHSRAI